MNSQEPGSDFILSAIERARKERGTPASRSSSAAATSSPVTAPWEALAQFTPDPGHLENGLVRSLRSDPAAKPFDMIRTKLLHQMRRQGWRRVAFASPDSGCGKTLLTVNVALSCARQKDLTAMAIELDMRRPSMARVLGLKSGHQFSDVLADRAAPADHLARIGDNLAVATNAKPEPAAAELLASRSAGHVIDRIESEFAPSVMVFDLPPLLMTDDAMAFIDQIDCVLLVAVAERNTMAEITHCAQELAARCNFLGVILNKCRFKDTADSYGYGYGA
ncbi:MAG: CpsD/CapB family tyrosine-protein kinase [Roseinatronobacter sp.]